MRNVLDKSKQRSTYIWRLATFLLGLFFFLQFIFPHLRVCLRVNGMSSVVVNATARQTATVIFLHGLGDTGHGWSAGFQEIALPYVKYIFPNAPVQSVTLNFGMKMPSWFDIKSLDFRGPEDVTGIEEAANNLSLLIEDEEKKGIASNRIVIGGFSQGGAVALYTALTCEKPLAGVLALSTWLPLHSRFPQAQKGNKNTPFFQAHGEVDPVVNLNYGKMTSEVLKKLTTEYTWKTYQGLAHSSSPQEMNDVKKWLSTVLPKQD